MRDTTTRHWSRVIDHSAALAVLVVAVCLAVDGGRATAPAASGEPLTIAFFGFELLNTSPEPTTDAERARIAMVGEQLVRMLEASGRYHIVPLSDEVKKKVAESPAISGCNGCQIDWAREAGADLAAWGMVQKVSNLILNINVSMHAARDGRRHFGRSVDIRGNTDESWQRGVRYLVRHYLLDED